MIKPEQKRLDRSTKTGAHQPQMPINPAFEPRIGVQGVLKCQNHSTVGQKELIRTQNSRNVKGKALYLGNVGLNYYIQRFLFPRSISGLMHH